MKREEFGIVFAVMAEYFGAAPSEGLTQVYYELLKDLPIEHLKRACRNVMESRVYNSLPKVAEIKEAIYGNSQDLPVLAYQKLVETMKRVGPWDTVIFEDVAIGKAIEAMGGWEAVNDIPLDEWKFRRKEFESLYIANLRKGNTDPVKLFGAFDRINGATGQQGWNKALFIQSEVKPLISGTAKAKIYQISEKHDGEDLTELEEHEVETNYSTKITLIPIEHD